MVKDESIYQAIEKADGKVVSIWEIAVAAGVRPSEMGDLKRRLRELEHSGALQRRGKGYRRAPAGDGAGKAAMYEKQSRTRAAAKRAPWEGVEVAEVPRKVRRGAAPEPAGRRRRGGQVVGIVRSKQEGYGFLQRLDGEGEDLFLPPHEAQRAMDGDRVRVRIVPGRYGRDVAQIVEILEHRRRQLLGTYHSKRKLAWIEPLDPNLPWRLPVRPHKGVREGQAVKATITRYEEEGGLQAEILEVAGEAGDPKVEILEIAYRKGFSDLFPRQVLREASALPEEVTSAERMGRVDLREMPLITIDGPDAQDFDDAIFVEKIRGGGFRLVVAIADVSHYVEQGSAIDEEAFLRGTSLYFPTTVLPMLPENISNEICSLQPGVDRLCMVADITFDSRGTPKNSDFYEGVMNSHARCTYGQVAALLGGEEVPELDHVEGTLRHAAALAAKLRKKRIERGALDFDLPEARVLLDEDSVPTGIAIQERNDAHRMIEEFMLAANEAVARFFEQDRIPTIFRVHDVPDPEKLETFAKLGNAVGLELDIEDGAISPIELSVLLRKIEGTPQQKALNSLLLRAMMQAVYSPDNIGHFGLATEHYLHFTAPIRRYPDLVVHRLLKERLTRKGRRLSAGQIEFLEEELAAVAAHSSEQERAAMDAEREADRFLKCLFMRDKVGDRFDATIVGVADFGIFAEIDEFLIEGLIRGEEIGVEFAFDEERQRLVFPRAGRSFGVGEKVRVEVAGVDVPKRQIHMALVADQEGRLLPSQAAEKAARMMATAWPGAKKSPAKNGTGKRSTQKRAPARKQRPGRSERAARKQKR